MKNLVIKVGGAFMQAEHEALALLKVIQQLKSQYNVILMHGGGPMVEQLLAALGLISKKIDGLRVTPKEHMPYITGALAGTANKQLCSLAIKAGLVPVGLSLADGNISRCKVLNEKLGSVGIADSGDSTLLENVLRHGWLPIVSSIGADPTGKLLNVNADQAAAVIARAIDAELIMLSDVPGVLNHQGELIASLTAQDIARLEQKDVIRDGMKVKVRAALDTANSLRKPVTIAGWKHSQTLLGLLAAKPIGTKIIPQIDQQEKQ